MAGKLEMENFSYVGFRIRQEADGIQLDQSDYVSGITTERLPPDRLIKKQEPLTDRKATTFRSLAGCINWSVQGSRPDAAYDLVDLSTRFNRGKVEDLARMIKVVKKLQDKHSMVYFPDLGDVSSWRLVLFTDAAHANLCDGVGSTMAHVLFLVGENLKCCPLSWGAKKIKRVVRSTLAAEALSLQEGLEEAFYIRAVIGEFIPGNVAIYAHVDNKSTVEAIYSTKLVDDRRLRIDIAAIKQSIDKGEITTVRWIEGNNQIANCLTKAGASGNQLLAIFQGGKLLIDV